VGGKIDPEREDKHHEEEVERGGQPRLWLSPWAKDPVDIGCGSGEEVTHREDDPRQQRLRPPRPGIIAQAEHEPEEERREYEVKEG
jgi:hypothetical protein